MWPVKFRKGGEKKARAPSQKVNIFPDGDKKREKGGKTSLYNLS